MTQKPTKLHQITYAPPPLKLPVYQRVDPKDVCFFGRTNYEAALDEKKFVFGIKRADRKRHIYVIGRSGAGKSKLLELLLRQDIAYGYGACLIDPEGDLTRNILDFIPSQRVNDVVLIDPLDKEWPVSFNPLAQVDPELRHIVAEELVDVMARQFGEGWTASHEHVFRFMCLAMLDYPKATVAGMLHMFKSREFRTQVASHTTDEMVRRFWEEEYDGWAEKYDSIAITPLVNKLAQILANPLLRNILSQEENKIDFERIIKEKKIVLVNLSKGRLGEEAARFFGSLILIKLHEAGILRTQRDGSLADFYVYIDEFPSLMSRALISSYSRANAFGFSFAIAHQNMAQLADDELATILGGTGTIVSFRVGGDDALVLEREMSPVFRARDMINLGQQELYIKLMIDGEAYDPFSADMLRVLPVQHKSHKDEIRDFSRSSYTKRA